jgi:O-antigen/teichoic acid export membrane protein
MGTRRVDPRVARSARPSSPVRHRLKDLISGVAIYGAGGVAISVVRLLLLPVYIKGNYLTAADYGALAIVGGIEMFLKVVFRWGLDGSFMRFYYDRQPGRELQRLASTIFFFMLGVNAVVLALCLALSGPFARHVFDDPRQVLSLRLMLVNTFCISFTFLPFHVMRMRKRAMTFSAFEFARSSGTLVMTIIYVIGLHMGIPGMYLADVTVTAVLLPCLWRWFADLVRPTFSVEEMRAALRFGLPRLPHGVAVQTLDGGNRLLFARYVSDVELGIYNIGVTLGQGIKFFLSSFETAWAPFYYEAAREPNAKEILRKMTTYCVAVLALLVAGTTAVAHDAILLMATPAFLDGARVMPLIALGLAFQGLYLLTSIGLNLTNRTAFYPVSTGAAAVVGLGSGVPLMAHYGAIGAATAFLLSYMTQASVAFVFAQRFYPMRYEVGRIARIVIAGVVASVVAVWVIPPLPALPGFFARGTTTVVVYAGLLAASGFLRITERRFLSEALARLRRRGPRRALGNAE